jgi:formylmethanofuran dehydrogenase subunit E
MTDQETITQVAEFHGHMCPGLALGIRAAEVALAETGPHSSDEEVVAVVETDMCGVDALQYLTGCTFGKGNLVHLDHGKNVFTFLRRSDGRAVRISMRPGGFGPDDPAREELRARIKAGVASDEERARFWRMQQERADNVLAAPLEQLYEVRDVTAEPPPVARIHSSVECADCGEPTMETRIRQLHGQQLCLPCFELGMSGRRSVRLSSPAQPRSG